MTKFLNISTDNTLGGSSASDEVVSSQKAIKDYTDNALSDKVSKTGDTMSGGLNVPNFHVVNQNITKGTSPSSTQYSQVVFNDSTNSSTWQATRLGIVELKTETDGSNEIRLSATKNEANSTDSAMIWSKIKSDGTTSSGFPNTKCVDGQWTNSNYTIASGLSGGNSYTNTFTIATSAVPDDGYPHEIILHAEGRTGASSGNSMRIYVGSTIMTTETLVVAAHTRSSNYVFGAGTAIIPIGTDRKLTISFKNQSGTSTNVALYMQAYRRIGSNS